MIAKESKILRLIDGSDKKFVVPVYQRPYSWRKSNCVQLLKDLDAVYENNYQSHFFGSIVFVTQKVGSVEENMIIDGQQRITTISLLLLAIRNFVIANPKMEININTKKIMNAYLTDEYAENEKKLKLKLVQGDDESYNDLIEGKEPDKETYITINYKYFYSELKKMSPAQIEGLNDAISKLDIVCINLDPKMGDDPQLIFESLNSTGMDLEPIDKIRNYVLMGMNAAEQEIFYKKYWEPLEKICNKKEINSFIRYYLAVKDRKLSKEDKLYLEFKHFAEQSGESMESILEDILKYAKYYSFIYDPDSLHNSCSEVLKRINYLGVKTCIPLLMDLMNANDNGLISEDEMREAFEIIENFVVRHDICGLPTNLYNKLFVQLGFDIEKCMEKHNLSYFDAFVYQIMKRTDKGRFPNNHDFADKFPNYELYQSKSAMKKYILERLENYNNRERVDVVNQIDNQELTIEHIMPQTLSDEWKTMLGDNWELTYSKYLHTVGNLTLTAYNSDYSNSPFKKKKNLQDKGFIYSKLSLNDYVRKCDKWGEEEITERAKLLYEKAEKIWWMPESVQIENDEDEWFNWDDDFDVTNKKITEICVLDTTITTKDMTDAFKKINSMLYDLDPGIYQDLTKPWFSNVSSNLRTPYQLADNAYIELCRGNRDKLAIIQTLAELFDLDSGDIKFLVHTKTEDDQISFT